VDYCVPPVLSTRRRERRRTMLLCSTQPGR
jgi:hypothetical protein